MTKVLLDKSLRVLSDMGFESGHMNLQVAADCLEELEQAGFIFYGELTPQMTAQILSIIVPF